MNHLTHPEAPAIGGFGKVPRESACCAAVHIATKLKLQSECFIFFLHVFPHEKFPGSLEISMVFPSFSIIFHGFPMENPMENPIFPTSRMRSHGEALSYVCPCPALGGLPKTWSFQSPEVLAPWHDPEMGRWDVGDIVCIYIYIEIDRFS